MNLTHSHKIRQNLLDSGFILCKYDDRWHVCLSDSDSDKSSPLMSSKSMGDVLSRFEKEMGL